VHLDCITSVPTLRELSLPKASRTSVLLRKVVPPSAANKKDAKNAEGISNREQNARSALQGGSGYKTCPPGSRSILRDFLTK